MADINKRDDPPEPGNRNDVPAARNYSIWLALWILIGLGLITWVFM